MNVPILSLKIISGGTVKNIKHFSIFPSEVFCEAKNVPNLFSAVSEPTGRACDAPPRFLVGWGKYALRILYPIRRSWAPNIDDESTPLNSTAAAAAAEIRAARIRWIIIFVGSLRASSDSSGNCVRDPAPRAGNAGNATQRNAGGLRRPSADKSTASTR